MSDSSDSEDIVIKTTNKPLPTPSRTINMEYRPNNSKQELNVKLQKDYNHPAKKSEAFNVKIDKRIENKNKREDPQGKNDNKKDFNIAAPESCIQFTPNFGQNAGFPIINQNFDYKAGELYQNNQNSGKVIEDGSGVYIASNLPGGSGFAPKDPISIDNKIFLPQGNPIPSKPLVNINPMQPLPIPNAIIFNNVGPNPPNFNTSNLKPSPPPNLNPTIPSQAPPKNPYHSSINMQISPPKLGENLMKILPPNPKIPDNLPSNLPSGLPQSKPIFSNLPPPLVSSINSPYPQMQPLEVLNPQKPSPEISNIPPNSEIPAKFNIIPPGIPQEKPKILGPPPSLINPNWNPPIPAFEILNPQKPSPEISNIPPNSEIPAKFNIISPGIPQGKPIISGPPPPLTNPNWNPPIPTFEKPSPEISGFPPKLGINVSPNFY
ncbi:hypothetical protein SteCoe_2529 [Stentor coeruleus]|uniref:Uncharacterized protein n=1 Tax=Stentor coeruleus TaxID=5963 RepID=A0A1R2CZ98_9CILI|nr:hypothetical protein SteCoe_2529 [Stentor coeruleus]